MKRLFGISQNVKSRLVRVCTAALFREAVDSPQTARVCAEIADALEAVKRGELSREEFETLKADRKRLLPVLTPHATFTQGRRVNTDAVPSGLCMLDVDHLPDARGFYEANVRGREEVLGILLAHITPSCEGLRLVFVLPDAAMELEAAQRWMAGRLGMKDYDGAVKDLARCSFLVPRDYFLYLNEAELFGEAAASSSTTEGSSSAASSSIAEGSSSTAENSSTASSSSATSSSTTEGSSTAENSSVAASSFSTAENSSTTEGSSSAAASSSTTESSSSAAENSSAASGLQAECAPAESDSGQDAYDEVPCFRGVPYSDIIQQWLMLTGGEPVKGERNTRLHRLAYHLRYITDNDETLIKRILPRYGLGDREIDSLVHSACMAKFCSTPTEMKKAVQAAFALAAVQNSNSAFAANSAYAGGFASVGAGGSTFAGGPTSSAAGTAAGFANASASAGNSASSSVGNSSPVGNAASAPAASAAAPASASAVGGGIGGTMSEDSLLPPPMPQQLPALIELLLMSTPEVYRPAVAHAVFPALGAHLHRTTFRYIDNVCHEATLMNVLMAGTGAGKDCISEPINRIMADIRERDAENLRREREWKEEVTSKGANKDKRRRPEGLVIQEIDADMTNPAFVMRTAEADGHFLYTKMNEIDQFDALRGSARGGQQFQIMCLAFDPGNRYGQTRVGAASVTEKVCVRFNWNASTTILKGKQYFSGVLTDGPLSRINFCTIPEREIGAEMPVYGSYGPEFDEELRPYIDCLCRASGEIDCPEASRLALQLREECVEQAVLSQNRVYENLSYRATVIAWLKGCVLYVANGCRWDPTFDAFVRWSLQYDLWCKMVFFGREIEEAMQAPATSGGGSRGPQNLLSRLPDRFTFQEALNARMRAGMDPARTWPMLRLWKTRGYIRVEVMDGKGCKDGKLPGRRESEIYIKEERWK